MSDEIEALGAVMTAGLAADAIDRPHSSGRVTHGACANCAAPLSGNFCAACGQKAHLHRSLADVGHEFVHGITHFDGKAWKTLPMLVFRPGTLTREYIMGKRAKYVAPVPLFLLVVFLMFFVFSFVHIADNVGGGATGADGKQLTKAQAALELPKVEAELAKLDADIKAARTGKSPGPGEIEALQGVRAGVAATRNRVRARAATAEGAPADLREEIIREVKDSNPTVNFGNKTLNEKALLALKNPELTLYKVQGKAYKFSFVLVPLSLPWLWLMFAWKRDVRLYDHAIFALYSISFMSLLFIIGSGALSLSITSGWLWVPLLLAPFVHMYGQLKGAYGLPRFGALWRMAGLSLGAIVSLGIYATLILALGVID